MTQIIETLIIGAGPAGCAAAHDLAVAGRQVLLLDKSTFPRLKPCAGALTPKTLRILPFDIAPILRQTCTQMILSLGRQTRSLGNNLPIAAMTIRKEFDHYFLQQCQSRGVDFKPNHRVTQITRAENHWLVTTPHETFRAQYLIGADGATGQSRKFLLPGKNLPIGLALETCIPIADWSTETMAFDFAPVDRGYAWIFPKHDHLNIGLYTLNPTIPRALEKLSHFVKEKTGQQITSEIHGHKIPHDGRRFHQPCENACLIGDAAGFIDPFLGEGIYHAIRSGQLAARAILESRPGQQINFNHAMNEITQDLAAYDSETRRFYANINRGYRRLARTPLASLLVKGFTKGWTVRQIKRKLLLLPFQV